MKNSIFITLFYFVIFCHLGSMAMAAQQRDEPNSVNKQTVCIDPRPQVCSMDYRPVCAQLEDTSFKTYSNGCTACSDPRVKSYEEGACRK
jgi:Kazal-type serine protease inhibitor domain